MALSPENTRVTNKGQIGYSTVNRSDIDEGKDGEGENRKGGTWEREKEVAREAKIIQYKLFDKEGA